MIKFKNSPLKKVTNLPLKKVTNLPLNKVTNFNQLVQNYCFTVGILISACTHIHKPDSIPTDSAIESTTNLVTTQIEDEVIGCLKHPDPNLTPQAKQSERRKYIEEAIEAARQNHLSEHTARDLTETLANEFYQGQYEIEIQQIISMLEAHLTLEQIITHLLKLQYPQKAIDTVLNTSKHLSPNENNQDQSARKEAYQLANQIQDQANQTTEIQKPTHKISESPRQELPISLRDNQELTIAPGDNQKYLFFPESYSIEGWENILLNNEPNTTIALQEYAHRAINILNQTLKKHPQIHPFNIIIATNPKFHPISIKQITKNPQVNGVYIGEGVTLSKSNNTLDLKPARVYTSNI